MNCEHSIATHPCTLQVWSNDISFVRSTVRMDELWHGGRVCNLLLSLNYRFSYLSDLVGTVGQLLSVFLDAPGVVRWWGAVDSGVVGGQGWW